MLDKLNCIKDFNRALREVILLVWMAKRDEKDFKRYKTNPILKSSLVLLVSKFESFLENSVEEYITIINQNSITIPEKLLLCHSEECLEKLKNKQENEKIAIFKSIKQLWNNENVQLNISNKFDYGKHGHKSINKLFSKIGFDNIMDSLKIFDKSSSFAEDNVKEEIDFKAKLNEIICKRNNIIHEDASLSFTPVEIAKYIFYFHQFSMQLEQVLRKELMRMLPSEN